jgi:NAD(P)H-dependent flavin oxidoreductase YrpB (nitropropane dioxygenase family)
MGTRFMATEEAPIHPNIKQTIIESNEQDTIHIFRTLKNTARVYKNKVRVCAVYRDKLNQELWNLDFNGGSKAGKTSWWR